MSSTEKVKAWRKANPEKYKAQRARYYAKYGDKVRQKASDYRAANPDKTRAALKQWRVKTGYKTQPGRRSKLEIKAGRPRPKTCEVCGSSGKIMFEHDHTTGKFRGWLCGCCNTALGMVKDRPDILRALALYLEACRE
jgi:hypothetical protein